MKLSVFIVNRNKIKTTPCYHVHFYIIIDTDIDKVFMNRICNEICIYFPMLCIEKIKYYCHFVNIVHRKMYHI